VVVRVPVASQRSSAEPAKVAAVGETEGNPPTLEVGGFGNHDRNGRDADAGSGPRADASGAARLEKHVVVQFVAGEAFMAKVERLRSLAWHRLPANATLEQVFDLALDVLIDRDAPEKREARRDQKRKDRQTPKSVSATRAKKGPGHDARTIATPVRDGVFVRDQGRCSYVGPSGRRCGSTRALQIDHVIPVARGGTGTPKNLRVLCTYHNRLEAERILGSKVAGKRAIKKCRDIRSLHSRP
jgi:5-methylcytosine-specific restriction endonuclease McrA